MCGGGSGVSLAAVLMNSPAVLPYCGAERCMLSLLWGVRMLSYHQCSSKTQLTVQYYMWIGLSCGPWFKTPWAGPGSCPLYEKCQEFDSLLVVSSPPLGIAFPSGSLPSGLSHFSIRAGGQARALLELLCYLQRPLKCLSTTSTGSVMVCIIAQVT